MKNFKEKKELTQEEQNQIFDKGFGKIKEFYISSFGMNTRYYADKRKTRKEYSSLPIFIIEPSQEMHEQNKIVRKECERKVKLDSLKKEVIIENLENFSNELFENLPKIKDINSLEFKEFLNLHLEKYNIWEKENNRRLYIKQTSIINIYNTKKVSQNVYIDLTTFEVVSYTITDSQSNQWEDNENKRVKEGLKEFAAVLKKVIQIEIKPVLVDDLVQELELKNSKVKGYTVDWEKVKIPINRFGKLVSKNRRVCRAWEGVKFDAPNNFHELSSLDFNVLKNKYKGMLILEPPYNLDNKLK